MSGRDPRSHARPASGRRPLRHLLFAAGADRCIACGTCAAGCPVADWDQNRLDPRRMVRLIHYGRADLLIGQDWLFQCTNCGKCTFNCPAKVDLGQIISQARGLVERHRDPGPAQIQKTAELHRDTDNNMGLAEEDWLETAEWMAEELADAIGDFALPVDRHGAEYFATFNSKLPMYYPIDLQDIFKIFTLAGVDWTLPRRWWEGTNYAMFTHDEATWAETLRRQVAEAQRLGCRKMAYTECGHGYYATLSGLRRFGIETDLKVIHVVSLYAQWIREGRFALDPSRNPQRITIHDPCNATRKAALDGFPSIADDLRFVLDHVCQEVVEPTPNREANICCGGGGGTLLAGFKQARLHYGRPKVDQIDRTGAELVCTPCVNCLDAIEGLARAYERPWRPIHLWKLLARAIVVPS